MQYLDFDLGIELEGGRHYRIVVRSPAGETQTTMSFPLDEVAVDHYLTYSEGAS